MKLLKYLTITIGLATALSVDNVSAYDTALSIGNLCEYVGKIQTDDTGSTNLCSFKPYFAGSIDYIVTNELLFSPQAGFSIPQSGRDQNIKKMSLFILANAKYKFSSVYLIGGTGLFFTRIQGSGGMQSLNNGNSVTSFPMPESTVYTRNLILNLGLGTNITKEWSADLHTYIFNLTTSEDRAFSIAFNGTYHFGEF